ncbi:hypothetical protein [Dechloromonas sp. A34]|uniref:hypothetical protein n=1 Tax=Dechloromonas sp. A34 TaxID=447588 RepID=UPI0022496776|nr:hypothetical protein [Dechloromonas sp. A34]
MLVCRYILLGMLCALAPQVRAAPYTPEYDATVIERLPFRAADATARELAALRTAVAARPSDQAAAVALAQKYFDLAMARGDPRYIGYADAIIGGFSPPCRHRC